MLRIRHNVDMTGRNTFGMKVTAACVVEYDCPEDLEGLRALQSSGKCAYPVLHIGAGSNLLFTKEFFPGTLLHSNSRFIGVEEEACGLAAGEVAIEVGAAVPFDEFCSWAARKGLWGVENLSGIPGETGAAAVQNIGAYGVEAKDIILTVNCYDMVRGRRVSFPADDCGYGYRDSLFKRDRKGRYIVTSVTFRLYTEPHPMLDYGHIRAAVEAARDSAAKAARDNAAELTPQLIRDVILQIRDSKLPDPKKIGSAGSFFKNPVVPKSAYDKAASIATLDLGPGCTVPCYDMGSGFVKIPAAWLIEQCGWKGYRSGNVGVYEKQPLVLINATGEATPAEVIDLETKIIASVKEKFDITLSPEVEHV